MTRESLTALPLPGRWGTIECIWGIIGGIRKIRIGNIRVNRAFASFV